MTLENFYSQISGDFADVTLRLGGEHVVGKFLAKFLHDNSYAELCAALDNSDADSAFRAAHTLKGVCLNLGLGILTDASIEITEVLRSRDLTAASALMPTVADKYQTVVSLISATDL